MKTLHPTKIQATRSLQIQQEGRYLPPTRSWIEGHDFATNHYGLTVDLRLDTGELRLAAKRGPMMGEVDSVVPADAVALEFAKRPSSPEFSVTFVTRAASNPYGTYGLVDVPHPEHAITAVFGEGTVIAELAENTYACGEEAARAMAGKHTIAFVAGSNATPELIAALRLLGVGRIYGDARLDEEREALLGLEFLPLASSPILFAYVPFSW